MDLQGTQGVDTLTGGAENDTLYGYGGNDTLKGGAGDDVLAGNDGNDILQGGDGDDYILGGAGNDTIDGGAGNDWAAYEDATAGVKVDLTLTGTQNTVGAGTDKLTSIENVYGSAFNDTLSGNAEANMLVGGAGNDTVSGGKGDDTLWGSAGNDTLDGGDGDDYMVGGAGDDIIKGGAGWDWSSYEDATAGVTVDLNKTTAQNTGGGGTDTITGVEHLYGSAFNDVLTGDAKDNYLWGDAGDDKLVGGAGDDHLSGGAGADVIDGGDGFDTVDYAFSEVGLEIDLTRNVATSRDGASISDALSSIEAVMGSSHMDFITGNAAENYLYGDAGTDILTAVGGLDTLDGGEGDDILVGSISGTGDMLIGGAGNDFLSISAGSTIVDGGAGIDTLQARLNFGVTVDLRLAGNQQIANGVYADLRSIENIVGGQGGDRLTGDANDNMIEGGGGDDVMDGGAGFDIANYHNAASGVRVDLSKVGIAQDTHGAGSDTLSNFEGLRGSTLGDILIGDAKDNSFQGGAGADIIDGGAGADTAIYLGESRDYNWARNANGTWTVSSLSEGVDTLLNVETLKFTDKSVTLTPSTTAVKVDDLLGASKTLGQSSNNYGDIVFSPDGRTIYVAERDGYLEAIDTTSGEVKSHVKLAVSSLNGLDISADGRFIAAISSGMVVHVLDLLTGVAKDYTASPGFESLFGEVAFNADGKILVAQVLNGSATAPILTLDLSTGAFTAGTTSYTYITDIASTEDHQKLLLVEGTLPTLHLVTSDGVETASRAETPRDYLSSTVQAISNDGSLVAQRLSDDHIKIYDGSLKPILDLTSDRPELGGLAGMDFSADGKHLYVVSFAKDQIFQYSTKTWNLEKVSNIGIDFIFGGFAWNSIATVNHDGSQLVIANPDQIVAIKLDSLTSDSGTDGADVLLGSSGVDHLFGYGGNDILVGGKGADVLTGGKGLDIFMFDTGDTTWSSTSDSGVDVIKDWDGNDCLSLNLVSAGAATGGGYSEHTASSWSDALTKVTSLVADRHAGTMSVQVGSDVYVFSAASDVIQNVVKLANATLDNIELSNFSWLGTSIYTSMGLSINGDDTANTLIGTVGCDVISGGGGNDIIQGGWGVDTLIGGEGADVFKFVAGEGHYDRGFTLADVIIDFGGDDKLGFTGASAVIKESDILRFTAGLNPDGAISAASQLSIDAYGMQVYTGALSQKYLLVGAGADTYVLAENDVTHVGYDQVILLKGVSSSLVTADMFMAA